MRSRSEEWREVSRNQIIRCHIVSHVVIQFYVKNFSLFPFSSFWCLALALSARFLRRAKNKINIHTVRDSTIQQLYYAVTVSTIDFFIISQRFSFDSWCCWLLISSSPPSLVVFIIVVVVDEVSSVALPPLLDVVVVSTKFSIIVGCSTMPFCW